MILCNIITDKYRSKLMSLIDNILPVQPWPGIGGGMPIGIQSPLQHLAIFPRWKQSSVVLHSSSILDPKVQMSGLYCFSSTCHISNIRFLYYNNILNNKNLPLRECLAWSPTSTSRYLVVMLPKIAPESTVKNRR